MGKDISKACKYYRAEYNIDVPIFRYGEGVIIQSCDMDKLEEFRGVAKKERYG